jgi:aminopeptidase
VIVSARFGHEALAREIVRAAYDRGAYHVQVDYEDPWVSRIRLQRAPEQALGEVVPWVRGRPHLMAEARAAWIGLSGLAAPGLLDDLDPARIGRDSAGLVEWAEVIDRRQITWTIVPGPTEPWARLVFGDGEADPLAALWERVATICRLDEPDPARAWRERSAELRRTAERLDGAGFDALRFRGPGTDLTVGLLPGVTWSAGGLTSAWGVEHVPNLPTEEVFTSPDPERTDGVVTSTKPLLVSGRLVSGLRVRFAGGRAVEIEADEGGELLRELVRRDIDAGRLGEVALVDGSSRVGATGNVFHNTLLDENAASHIALGSGFQHLAADAGVAARVNSSAVHTDFMIGGPGVDVTGVRREGGELPVLAGGEWAL